jgi:hypothetical protein
LIAMKRSAALIPLSRDHHVALELALRLKRADGDVGEVAGLYQRFLEGRGGAHFATEEAVLPSAIAGDPDWDRMCERMRDEHQRMRAAAIAGAEDARRLGELLADHVRFEERELFVHLERALPEAALAAVGERLHQSSAPE